MKVLFSFFIFIFLSNTFSIAGTRPLFLNKDELFKFKGSSFRRQRSESEINERNKNNKQNYFRVSVIFKKSRNHSIQDEINTIDYTLGPLDSYIESFELEKAHLKNNEYVLEIKFNQNVSNDEAKRKVKEALSKSNKISNVFEPTQFKVEL